MEIRQITYFRALSQELNFTRAARHCKVSQPSLTRAIRLLEEELGGILFHRERNTTHLSELGLVMKPHFDEICERMILAKQQAQHFKVLAKVRLKLGVMSTIAPSTFMRLVTDVCTRHPGIDLEIANADAPDIYKDLELGKLEVAIIASIDNGRDPNLRYVPLFEERLMLALCAQHRLANQVEVRAIDLDNEAFLQRVRCRISELARRVIAECGATIKTTYRSDRDDWILAMVAAGMGFACMPQQIIDYPGVIAKPLADPELWREVSLVTVRGRQFSPAVNVLVQAAQTTKWMNGDRRPSTSVEQAHSEPTCGVRAADASHVGWAARP